jgi:hypothetical protein
MADQQCQMLSIFIINHHHSLPSLLPRAVYALKALRKVSPSWKEGIGDVKGDLSRGRPQGAVTDSFTPTLAPDVHASSFPSMSPRLQPCYAQVAHREANGKLHSLPRHNHLHFEYPQQASRGPMGELVSPLTTTTTTTYHPTPRPPYTPLIVRHVTTTSVFLMASLSRTKEQVR